MLIFMLYASHEKIYSYAKFLNLQSMPILLYALKVCCCSEDYFSCIATVADSTVHWPG